MCSEPDLCPRLCLLKREEGQGFGFYLRKESGCRGHIVQQVAPWSAAERSGLRAGDRILEVNEVFVDNQEYTKVHTYDLKGCCSSTSIHLLLVASYTEFCFLQDEHLRSEIQAIPKQKCYHYEPVGKLWLYDVGM